MLLFLLGVSTAAQADETTAEKKFGSLLDSKFNIALGGFFPRVDSTLPGRSRRSCGLSSE
jgi:hypothetical protein